MEEMAAQDPHTLTPTPPQGSITNIRSARSPVESAVCEWGCRTLQGKMEAGHRGPRVAGAHRGGRGKAGQNRQGGWQRGQPGPLPASFRLSSLRRLSGLVP